MTLDDMLDEQALVDEIKSTGMHPQFSDVERRLLLAEAKQAKVVTPLLARLIVALDDADQKLRQLEDEYDKATTEAYDQGWRDAEEEAGR